MIIPKHFLDGLRNYDTMMLVLVNDLHKIGKLNMISLHDKIKKLYQKIKSIFFNTKNSGDEDNVKDKIDLNHNERAA